MRFKMHSRLSFITAFLFLNAMLDAQFRTSKDLHEIKRLSDEQIQYIAKLEDKKNFEQILDEILIPRVVGTPNHLEVQNVIKTLLQQYGFTIEIDKFTDMTPTHGILTFNNIIGRLNPHAERFLVLACHYDSKYFEDENFVGATDSAVPCAMMLNLIKTMQNELQLIKNEKVSLMLLFLDGEEAFHTWTDTDSIYGARNLASKWHSEMSEGDGGTLNSKLDMMDVFVLLDLLGVPNPKFLSYFRKTDRHYLALSRAEDKLEELNLLKNHKSKYFKESASNSFVQDDHIPFMYLGVPILHIIPSPFPPVWHTPQDDRNAIDFNTVENLCKIFRVFVAEYLHVPVNNDNMDEGDESDLDTRSRDDL